MPQRVQKTGLKNMDTLILTEGGKGRGFGHLTRCAAIAQAVGEAGAGGARLIVDGDAGAEAFLEKHGFDAVFFDWKADTAKAIDAAGAGPVVIDSFLAGKDVYEAVSEATAGRLLMIDDYNRLDYPRGVVVRPSIYGGGTDHTRGADTECLGGRDYIVLRKAFWEVPEKPVADSLGKILLTLGYTEDPLFTEGIAGWLRERTGLEVHVIDTRKNSVGAAEMLEMMMGADVCVSAGGQTTNELARVGLPSIGICFAENQIHNLEGWHEAGLLDFIGWHDEAGLKEKLAGAVKRISPFEDRKKRSLSGRKLVDGKGAKRIAAKLRQMKGD